MSQAMYCLSADIGTEYGDVRPLDAAQLYKLSVNSVHLLDLISSNEAFISELASPTVSCITSPQRDHLVNIGQTRDRNYRLLELLTHRSLADFRKFTEVLSKYQAYLVCLLVTDGGERHCYTSDLTVDGSVGMMFLCCLSICACMCPSILIETLPTSLLSTSS